MMSEKFGGWSQSWYPNGSKHIKRQLGENKLQLTWHMKAVYKKLRYKKSKNHNHSNVRTAKEYKLKIANSHEIVPTFALE